MNCSAKSIRRAAIWVAVWIAMTYLVGCGSNPTSSRNEDSTPPEAHISVDSFEALLHSDVVLDASRSTPEDSIREYHFDFGDGTQAYRNGDFK